MSQRSLLRLAPQRVLNSIIAALLLMTTPVLSHGGAAASGGSVVTVEVSTADAVVAVELPLTAAFHDRMGTAVLAHLPAPLATDGAAQVAEYVAGDVAYVESEQSLVVFLSEGAAVPGHGLVHLGHVTDGLEDLAGCVRDCTTRLIMSP
jgi:hypothetical protein